MPRDVDRGRLIQGTPRSTPQRPSVSHPRRRFESASRRAHPPLGGLLPMRTHGHRGANTDPARRLHDLRSIHARPRASSPARRGRHKERETVRPDAEQSSTAPPHLVDAPFARQVGVHALEYFLHLCGDAHPVVASCAVRAGVAHGALEREVVPVEVDKPAQPMGAL